MSNRVNITILTGGFSNEREISLLTAHQVAKALSPSKYRVNIIDIKTAALAVSKISKLKSDVVYIALHGAFGEDGTLQTILDAYNIRYTGSGPAASAIAMNKRLCSMLVKASGILIPKQQIIFRNNQIIKSFSFPCIVKPNASGSSVGVSLAHNKAQLNQCVTKAFKEDSAVLIEEYVLGREFSCGVIGNQEDELRALPPIEIIVPRKGLFGYKEKYFSKLTKEICPASISLDLKEKIESISKKAHKLLSCEGLTRSDFIFSRNKLYFLEINTIPGQTATSLCPKEAAALGQSFPEFIEEQVQLALKK